MELRAGNKPPVGAMPPAAPVRLDLSIENVYIGQTVTTRISTEVPAPPSAAEQELLEDWAADNLFPLTGTGRTEGDAMYWVTVTASSDPSLISVGTTYVL